MSSLLKMHQHKNNASSTTKEHSNTVPQNESDNSPEIKLKITEYCNLTVMNKINKRQENSERQFNELGNKINEQKEYYTKNTDTQKNSKTNSRVEELSKQDEEYIRKHRK